MLKQGIYLNDTLFTLGEIFLGGGGSKLRLGFMVVSLAKGCVSFENPVLYKYLKRILALFGLVVFGYFIYNAVQIYQFSHEYRQDKSDVAIVLGAGTSDGKVSPVFRERINHAVHLYREGLVKKVIFTGGFGKGQSKSDSRIAMEYAIDHGLPERDILIEESSSYTIENLIESKKILDSLKFESVLLVSDPIHMKRSIDLAHNMGINCKSSPTTTSMYQSTGTKLKSLIYETVFYTGGKVVGKN